MALDPFAPRPEGFPMTTSTEFELTDLRHGDTMEINGEGLGIRAMVITEGSFPTCVFEEDDNSAPRLMQLLGTVGLGPQDESLTDYFRPLLDPQDGDLLYIELAGKPKARSGYLEHLVIRRGKKVVFEHPKRR